MMYSALYSSATATGLQQATHTLSGIGALTGALSPDPAPGNHKQFGDRRQSPQCPQGGPVLFREHGYSGYSGLGGVGQVVMSVVAVKEELVLC